MSGRARGEQERIIALAHQVESMARQKYLRPLRHYLPKNKRAVIREGAANVLAMLRRFKSRQDGVAP